VTVEGESDLPPAAGDRALAWASSRLANAGVPDSRLEARLLLGLATGASQAEVLAGLRRPLCDPEREALSELVLRRCRREPLAYLRGAQEFYGLRFAVNRGVLIPRPETELLVEFGLEVLGTHQEPLAGDVGTGSGCIAVALAVNLPTLRLVATDIRRSAAEVARRNAIEHGVADRVLVVVGDLLAPVRQGSLDLVVSNPPYIPSALIGSLQEEVRCWEPRVALEGGADGLSLVSRVARESRCVLRRGGWLAVEVAMGQANDARVAFERLGLRKVAARRDLAGVERIVVGRLV